ncbi:MAG: protein adenylyltransferase SelO family protein [Defluviimonas denitrificans]
MTWRALGLLTDHVIARHYPDADGPAWPDPRGDGGAGAYDRAWMSLGFIHGVMNTDNMAVSGETIDYGPCAAVDGYDPRKVFSSIDQFGRYAYANQPQVALWNLAQFASCLIPLMGDEDTAIAAATEAVNGFTTV